MSAGVVEAFAVVVTFEGDQVVVGVRGEVDALTAPTLASVLAGIIADRHDDVVLDLSGVAFMGAAGVGVIAVASVLLTKTGDALALRSASPQVERILAITGVGALVRSQRSVDASGGKGAESRGDRPRSDDDHHCTVASALSALGALPAGHVHVDAVFQLVTILASAVVEGADGVSITMDGDGVPFTVASSNDTVLRMDEHQYATGEGPCLSAAVEGRTFWADSLATEVRWPAFVRLAKAEGIACILSTPLLIDAHPVGAINIYSGRSGAFGAPQFELAGLFAAQMSELLSSSVPAGIGGDPAMVAAAMITQADRVLKPSDRAPDARTSGLHPR